MRSPIEILALISGGGRTVLNLLDAIDRGEVNAKVIGAVASRSDASGIARLEARGVPCHVVDQRDYRMATKNVSSHSFDGFLAEDAAEHVPPSSGCRTDWTAMNKAVNAIVESKQPDLVMLAGYMCLYHVPDGYVGRAMNIHPALIPSFCGKGMYGHHVHEAVVARGMKVTGCTVHFVDNEYDHGPIIVQRACAVFDTDSPDDVASRVFEEECRAYPEAIRLFADGRLSIVDGVVRVTK